MEKNTKWIIGIAILVALIFILPKTGLFVLHGCDTCEFVGTIGDIYIFYQPMDSGDVVRLEIGPDATTTWIGVYNITSNGKSNADLAKTMGWVNDTTYPILVSLLAEFPPQFTSEWCYQETTNISTSCGGLSTGSYGPDWTWYGNPESNLYDGNWDSYSDADWGTYFLINYSVPYNASINYSFWQVKDSEGTFNISLFGCSQPLNLNVFYEYNLTLDSHFFHYYCKTGNTWKLLKRNNGGTTKFYEEAVIWKMKTITIICNTPADINCDETVSRAELAAYITKWISGTATRTDLAKAIVAWVGG